MVKYSNRKLANASNAFVARHFDFRIERPGPIPFLSTFVYFANEMQLDVHRNVIVVWKCKIAKHNVNGQQVLIVYSDFDTCMNREYNREILNCI